MYLDAQSSFLLGDALAFPHPLLSDFPGDWPEISENLREISEISDGAAWAGASPALDWADPRALPAERPDDVCYLSLSSRWDLHVKLDRIDYEWAREFLWCHTYGSGNRVLVAPGVYASSQPNHIYARRSVPTGGHTPSGRPAYGNDWLHLRILHRAVGPPRYLNPMGDHLNGDTLDCRRRNLRWATPAMNARNVPGSRIRKRLARAAA